MKTKLKDLKFDLWENYEGDIVHVSGHEEQIICDIRGWGWLHKKYGADKAMEIQEGHGRLISHAPDMIKLIKKLKLFIEFVGPIYLEGYSNTGKPKQHELLSEINNLLES